MTNHSIDENYQAETKLYTICWSVNFQKCEQYKALSNFILLCMFCKRCEREVTPKCQPPPTDWSTTATWPLLPMSAVARVLPDLDISPIRLDPCWSTQLLLLLLLLVVAALWVPSRTRCALPPVGADRSPAWTWPHTADRIACCLLAVPSQRTNRENISTK